MQQNILSISENFNCLEKKIIYFAKNNFGLLRRVIFGVILTIIAFQIKSPYLFFFILATPQIFRRTFEKIINPMQMREIRIFIGPAAALLQILMLTKPTAIIKIFGIFYGIISVPQKN
jgi:hypothetical protein